MKEFCVRFAPMKDGDAARISKALRSVDGITAVEVDVFSGLGRCSRQESPRSRTARGRPGLRIRSGARSSRPHRPNGSDPGARSISTDLAARSMMRT
jgi:hypothetical protein